MLKEIQELLEEFQKTERVVSSGRLSMILMLSRMARSKGLPIDPVKIKTKGAGQVRGAGGGAIKKILAEYGIERKLSSEGGRTSRGSIGYSEKYIDLLNELDAKGKLGGTPEQKSDTLEGIEHFWLERVRDFFDSQKIKIPIDMSLSVSEIVSSVLHEAKEKQKRLAGSMIEGIVLQHLVGAKLDLAFPGEDIEHHQAFAGDQQTQRPADFVIGETAIHVTTAPTENLVAKCKDNLADGLRPIIICPRGPSIQAATVLADNAGVRARIEVFEAQAFISTNLNEIAGFKAGNLKTTTNDFVKRYNEIVAKAETDPSLQLEDK